LIVVPQSPADVVASVTFAREHGLPIAMQGGGHGPAYPADGALLINFREMTGLQINREASTVRIEAGAKWAQVIEAAHPFGLAPLNGFASTVGVVGYLLGGGYGWLVRQYGLAACSLRSVDLVTADGRLLLVNEQSYPDLLWGLRGGGGNFGIVTALECALYPVKDVFGGQVLYPIEQGKEVARTYLDWVETVPVELTSALRIIHFPPLPHLPPLLRGKTVVLIAACYNGTAEDGETWLRPMRTLGTPLLDTFTQLPSSQVAAIANDPVESLPYYYYNDHRAMQSLTANDIDAMCEVMANSASGISVVEIRHLGGVLAGIPEDAMAASMRDVQFNVWASAAAPSISLLDIGKESITKLMQALKPDASVQALLNSLGNNDVGPDRTRAAYTAENYRRLVALKDKYDPQNVFCFNHNIPPSQHER
ncbi:MAG: FAD-dependent oxidoreductase, partial [Chloroflexi bacterium]|nr:FAD-dependent oxidoreductase [Chloroflexota bacterium]